VHFKHDSVRLIDAANLGGPDYLNFNLS
jgi:hypothetical protein